jgi:hypothetical protein
LRENPPLSLFIHTQEHRATSKTLAYSFAFVTISGLSWQFYLQVRAGKSDIATSVRSLSIFAALPAALVFALWEEEEWVGRQWSSTTLTTQQSLLLQFILDGVHLRAPDNKRRNPLLHFLGHGAENQRDEFVAAAL